MLVYFVLGMEEKKMDCYMHFLGKLKGGIPISLTFNTNNRDTVILLK